MFSQRRIARSLAALLAITLLQGLSGLQAPSAFAAPGSVGPATASGTCASSVGETTYVTATFNAGGFCLVQFSTSTTWTVPTGVTAIDILVVGGGGGGGADGGGGGGGGGVGMATGISVTAGTSATISVGLGGTAGSHTPGIAATSGGTSSFLIAGTTYGATGGASAVGWVSSANYAAGGSLTGSGTQLTGGTNYSKGGRNSLQVSGSGSLDATSPGYAGVTTTFTGTSTTFGGGGGGGICTDVKSDPTFGGAAGGAVQGVDRVDEGGEAHVPAPAHRGQAGRSVSQGGG